MTNYINLIDINKTYENEEEKDFSKFIVKPEQTNKDLNDFLTGKIKQGYKLGIDVIDNHFAMKRNEYYVLTGKKGSGKMQPFSSKIMTPKGWSTIGEVKKGDYIMCPVTASPVKIKAEFLKENLDIYKITFKDKTSVECCKDHLWKVQRSKDRFKNKFKIIDVNTMLKNGIRTSKGFRYSIPLTEPLDFKYKKTIIDPYFLGLMLGNGYLSSKNNVTLTFDEKYTPLVFDKIKNIIPKDVIIKLDKTYGKSKAQRVNFNVKIRKYFKELGLLDKKSRDKFIPKEYLVNSIDVRFKLLQGLMDSDGSCHITTNEGGYHTKRLSYSTMSEKLKCDVVELVKSLGGLVYVNLDKRDKYNGGICYDLK